MLELVVAASENDVIGRGNALPWHLPADLKHFRALTTGRHVLMGRRTYESIGKALPKRTNLVMSRSPRFAPADATVVHSVTAAQQMAGLSPLMVIGGAQIYRQCLSISGRIHLTLVHAFIANGDAFFGDWRLPEWRETAREHHQPDEWNALPYSFITLERD